MKIFSHSIVLLFCLLLSYLGMAQKNDTLILANSDKITGEIKRLQYGVLTFKTDDMGTLSVDWRKVRSLQTKKTFEIILSNGMIYYAGFDIAKDTNKMGLVIQLVPTPVINEIDKMRIVSLARIKGLFWSRIDGGVSIGVGAQKGNGLRKFNFNGNATYRDRKYISELEMRSNRSNTEGGRLNINQNIDLSFYRILSGKWFVGASTSAEQNTELGLDLRVLASVDIGDNLIQTNKNSFLILAGLQVTREWSSGNLSSDNLEGKLLLQHKLFSFRKPKINITTSMVVFPGLTDGGRWRTDFKFDASIEVFKDFIFSARVYHKYDNRPSQTATSNNDWGYDTSIGYTF